MKKFLASALLFSTILTALFSLNVSAVHSDPFKEYFEPFYNNNHSSYNIINSEGVDITESFLVDTYDWYLAGNWESISSYFNENVLQVSRTSSNTPAQTTRGRELPKSTTISYIVLRDVETSGHPFFDNSRIRVFYSLTYELYYDEDTHHVTRALSPRMSNPTYEFVSPTELYLEAYISWSSVNSYADISSGQSSVDFFHSFSVSLTTTEGGNYTSNYGTISSSYTMRV